MSERWAPGDHAKCVNVRDIRLPFRTIVARGGHFLEIGRVYTVLGLDVNLYSELCLDVGAEYGPKLARRFVKVAPEATSAGADAREKAPA
jgi:hypothetical protein